jgi:DNA-binding response OmpR family regulator
MSDGDKVLVADDDRDILELVAMRVARMGFEPIRATDGAQALAGAETHTLAAAVLDVMMPKYDGIEVTRRLRDRPETASLPILLLTARSQEEDISRGLASGADGYLTKPFDPVEFRERLVALVED